MKGTFWCCDKKTKPNDVYKIASKACSLNQDMRNLNGETNESLKWEEDGIVTSVVNMVNTTKHRGEHGGTTRTKVLCATTYKSSDY
jgi:hypothetical protein